MWKIIWLLLQTNESEKSFDHIFDIGKLNIVK